LDKNFWENTKLQKGLKKREVGLVQFVDEMHMLTSTHFESRENGPSFSRSVSCLSDVYDNNFSRAWTRVSTDVGAETVVEIKGSELICSFETGSYLPLFLNKPFCEYARFLGIFSRFKDEFIFEVLDMSALDGRNIGRFNFLDRRALLEQFFLSKDSSDPGGYLLNRSKMKKIRIVLSRKGRLEDVNEVGMHYFFSDDALFRDTKIKNTFLYSSFKKVEISVRVGGIYTQIGGSEYYLGYDCSLADGCYLCYTKKSGIIVITNKFCDVSALDRRSKFDGLGFAIAQSRCNFPNEFRTFLGKNHSKRIVSVKK